MYQKIALKEAKCWSEIIIDYMKEPCIVLLSPGGRRQSVTFCWNHMYENETCVSLLVCAIWKMDVFQRTPQINHNCARPSIKIIALA